MDVARRVQQHEIGPQVPPEMELMLLIHRDLEGELEIAVTGPVLAESEEQAREALALLETCPALDRAKLAIPYAPVRLEDLYAAVHESYPDDHRYGVDNMWTHAPIDDLKVANLRTDAVFHLSLIHL